MDLILDKFIAYTDNLNSVSLIDFSHVADNYYNLCEELFDSEMKCISSRLNLPISQLTTSGLDSEQIWQQLELHNTIELPWLTKDMAKVMTKQDVLFDELSSYVHAECGIRQEQKEVDEQEEGDGDSSGNEAISETVTMATDSTDPMKCNIFSDYDENGDDSSDVGPSCDEEDVREGGDSAAVGGRARTNLPIDDEFFNLGEMNSFITQHEESLQKCFPSLDKDESVNNIDLFADDLGMHGNDGEDEAIAAKYGDFFPTASTHSDKNAARNSKRLGKKSKVRFTIDHENTNANPIGTENLRECDTNDKSSNLSTFEKRNQRLRKQIEKLEEENISTKPWYMLGETSSNSRPENELLDLKRLDFEQTKHAPIISAEVTRQLERIIMQRVKDGTYDDVERKLKPVLDPYEYKRSVVMNQEKSKLSLAEVYQEEYKKKQELAEAAKEKPTLCLGDETENVPKEREEIQAEMTELFAKLDALSNLHYVPIQKSADIKVIKKLPSLSMEECIPLSVSEATLLAPEEIKAKRKGDLQSQEERDSTDRKRARRRKKLKQGLRRKHLESKQKQQSHEETDERTPGARRRTATAAEQHLQKERAVRVVKGLKRSGKVIQTNQLKQHKKMVKSSTAFFANLQKTNSARSEKDNSTQEKQTNTRAKISSYRL